MESIPISWILKSRELKKLDYREVTGTQGTGLDFTSVLIKFKQSIEKEREGEKEIVPLDLLDFNFKSANQ